MGLPNIEELDHCPVTPECVAKKLFRTGGKLYRFDTRTSTFVEHKCYTAGMESVLPDIVYVGKWKNHRTGRTRYNGPFRAKHSALKPPPDGGWKKKKNGRTNSAEEWELVQLLVAHPEWIEVTE